jgi:hypothetical protein
MCRISPNHFDWNRWPPICREAAKTGGEIFRLYSLILRSATKLRVSKDERTNWIPWPASFETDGFAVLLRMRPSN